MTYLITSDTHFSDRPKDAYRLGLFPWLVEQQQKYQPRATMLLGDMTEAKDRHSAGLVNQIVSCLKLLKPPVFILRGNHDCIDQDTPFFKFLDHIDGLEYAHSTSFLDDHKIIMVPHQTCQEDLDQACQDVPDGWGFMLHNTFDGAIAETGARMGGLNPPPSLFKARWCISGDIHRPQQVGPVVYCGAPYQVRFGDDYTPRVMLLSDNGKNKDLYFPAPRKWSLNIRDAFEITHHKELKQGDQVKIVIELARQEVVEWANHKEQVLAACRDRGVEVYGVEMKTASSQRDRIKTQGVKSDQDHFVGFCNAEQVPAQMRRAGKELLGDENGEGLRQKPILKG